jgi:hypothetical protein
MAGTCDEAKPRQLDSGFAGKTQLWHLSLRINRVLRVMLHTHWSAERGPWSGSSLGRRSSSGARSGARGGSSMRTRPESRQSCRVVLPVAASVNHLFAHVDA